MRQFEDHNLIEDMLALLDNIEDGSYKESGLYNPALQIKNFIDSLPGGFLIYHADGDEQIIYANQALIRLFRCDTFDEFKEYTGNSFKGIVYQEDLEEVEKSIEQQIKTSNEDLDYVEYRIMGKDGVLRWVEDYGHFVCTENSGNIFYVFITDATEKINRRNSERAALIREKTEKEKKLENLIEEYDKERMLIRQEHLQRLEVIEGLSANYDSILYVDLDANEVLPYRLSVRLNKQFEKKMQIREYLWFVDDYVKTRVHPDDRIIVYESISPDKIRAKLHKNQTFYFNYRCIFNDAVQHMQIRIVDVGNSGHISQIVIGFRNIDEEVMQEIKRKEILEEALRNAQLAYVAKNTFLSNMSHDMRTPLNAIFGYTALAQKNISDSKTVQTYLEKINTAGQQILDLIEKVLDISYMESQDFHLNETDCNLLDTVNEIYAELLPQAEKKNIEITLNCNSVNHAEIIADSSKLKQILAQIASNSVKYTNDGGKVELSVVEQKSVSHDYATFRFILKDNGIGIEKEHLQRIFEPFEREQNTTHSGVYGSGLGLTIAKHIIDMMGGNIQVESSVGQGSTFIVTLSFRLKNETAAPVEAAQEIQDKLNGKKILLVEDNEINLEIETEMLTDIGLVVDTAVNGKIAVEMVKKSKPGEYAFVLMDIQMPVMDGREAAKAIRALDNKELAGIPILALSANAFESDVRKSLESGMDAHLTKPIDIPVLLGTAAKTLKLC